MRKLFFALGIMVVALALNACKANREKSEKGIICEASMNTMMIVTATGDSLNVSTMDAERIAEDGILLGDTATIYYNQKTDGLIMATKLVVVPGVRECGDILGSWVEPIESMPGEVQGMKLVEGGMAESVNMATLVYENWSLEGEQLVLKGKSIGNGQTIVFSDTLHVDKVTADSLVLTDGNRIVRYSRMK